MARKTAMDNAIPTGVQSAVYQDARQLAGGLLGYVPECFIGQVLGAGGAGGNLDGVPFEPAVIIALEATGPTGTLMIRGLAGGAADVKVNLITLAAATIFPTISQLSATSWRVACPTALAPDGDTTTLLCFGVKNSLSGL